eukprot:TRINITY_DN71283_c0_g1_i2.p1 TRINITY_DN71283_c0_g1~~TRINITY_DN71283_c0_g1_i2.p1  ORF type:complete len:489 (+),score=104.80 TRINITY_DN71283_c0_g1_i2:82-1548(+)
MRRPGGLVLRALGVQLGASSRAAAALRRRQAQGRGRSDFAQTSSEFVQAYADCATAVVSSAVSATGVSWLACAVCLPWLLRATVTFPLHLTAQRQLQRDAPNIATGLREMFRIFKDYPDRQEARQHYLELRKRLGFHPMRRPFRALFVPLAAVPVHIGMVLAFRNLPASVWVNDELWFCTNLAAPDPTMMLPVACGVLTAAQMLLIARTMPEGSVTRRLSSTSGVLSGLLMIPGLGTMPAGPLVYITSNLSSLVLQNCLVFTPAGRTFLGLQPLGVPQKMIIDAWVAGANEIRAKEVEGASVPLGASAPPGAEGAAVVPSEQQSSSEVLETRIMHVERPDDTSRLGLGMTYGATGREMIVQRVTGLAEEAGLGEVIGWRLVSVGDDLLTANNAGFLLTQKGRLELKLERSWQMPTEEEMEQLLETTNGDKQVAMWIWGKSGGDMTKALAFYVAFKSGLNNPRNRKIFVCGVIGAMAFYSWVYINYVAG